MIIRDLLQRPSNWLLRPHYCATWRKGFLVVAFLGLIGQILYDQHLITVVSIFPQWLLLVTIWYSWQQDVIPHDNGGRGMLVFALLIPALSCLTLMVAWLGWKANIQAIGGVIPVSDSASYYISAQTFLREEYFDVAAQRRPLHIALTSLWLYLSGDDFRLLLLIQAFAFSVVAFLSSAVVAAVHGFRAGLLLFALLLVFAEPYLPTTLSETNGIIFGILSLVGFICALYRSSLSSYGFATFLLAMGLAIRPSALFVLPCVVVAGSMIFGTNRVKLLLVVVFLTIAVLLPSGISIVLNKTMSHHDGAYNGNLPYVIYGLVTGGKGWEQYQKDHPGTLEGVPEAERSHVMLEASWRHFTAHPVDLVQGLVKGQALGPLQTFAQVVRLAFLGAAGDPLRIVPSAAIIIISLLFAGVLWCQLVSRRDALAINSNLRLFCILFLIGYLVSIPFFYKDGGLRLHAAVLPVLSYMLVWVLLPLGVASKNALSNDNANRFLVGSIAFVLVLIGSVGWIALIHPKGQEFSRLSAVEDLEKGKMIFLFRPGWPQCDLRVFERMPSDNRPRWFSGAIPDDDYRSAGIKEISGRGYLYFGLDAQAGEWKVIHTDQTVGLLNKVEVGPGNHDRHRDNRYRDFYSAETVEVIGTKSTR